MDMQLGLCYANTNLTLALEYFRKSVDCKFTELEGGKTLVSVAEQLQGAIPPVLNYYLGEVFERVGAEAIPRAVGHYREAGTAYVQQSTPVSLSTFASVLCVSLTSRFSRNH